MFRSFKSHTIIIDTFQRTKLNFTMCFMLLSQTFIPNFHTYCRTLRTSSLSVSFSVISIMQETLKNIIHSEFFVGD